MPLPRWFFPSYHSNIMGYQMVSINKKMYWDIIIFEMALLIRFGYLESRLMTSTCIFVPSCHIWHVCVCVVHGVFWFAFTPPQGRHCCLQCIVFLCWITGIAAVGGRGLHPGSLSFTSVAWYLVTFLLACLASSCCTLCYSLYPSGLGAFCPYLFCGSQVFTVLQADKTAFPSGAWENGDGYENTCVVRSVFLLLNPNELTFWGEHDRAIYLISCKTWGKRPLQCKSSDNFGSYIGKAVQTFTEVTSLVFWILSLPISCISWYLRSHGNRPN